MLLGDSIPKYIENIPNMDNLSRRGYTFAKWVDDIQASPSAFRQYSVFLLHMGTNEIDNGMLPEDMLKDLIRLVQSIKLLGDPKILISSVLPRPKDFTLTNARVEEFNGLVRDLATTSPNLQYIRSFLPFFVKGKPRIELFSKRCGLHPTGGHCPSQELFL